MRMIEKHLLVSAEMARILEKWKRSWGVPVNAIMRALIRDEITRRGDTGGVRRLKRFRV